MPIIATYGKSNFRPSIRFAQSVDPTASKALGRVRMCATGLNEIGKLEAISAVRTVIRRLPRDWLDFLNQADRIPARKTRLNDLVYARFAQLILGRAVKST